MGKNSIKFKKRRPINVTDILDEQLIADYLNLKLKNSSWNETQLTLIINTITDAINVISNFYSYYPGSAIYLFEMVQENNQAQGSDQALALKKHATEYGIAMGYTKVSKLYEIRDTFYFLLRMSINDIFELQLFELQDEIESTEQLQEIHEILDYFLQHAINALTNSPYYQKAKREKHLYYHEPPIVIDRKRLNPPPIISTHKSEEKKRKRQNAEPSSSTFPQSTGTTFFNPRKKTKEVDSEQGELTKKTKHPISHRRK